MPDEIYPSAEGVYTSLVIVAHITGLFFVHNGYFVSKELK